jgi:hypothetical protein
MDKFEDAILKINQNIMMITKVILNNKRKVNKE